MPSTPEGFELWVDPQPGAATLHNVELLWLSAALGGGFKVVDRDLTAPPGSPTTGAVYIVATSPTGAWSGQAGKLALYDGSQWLFRSPVEGHQARVLDENVNLVYDGSSWGAI